MRFTPEQFAAHMERAANRLEPALAEAEAKTLEEALRMARVLSSGPFSLSVLAAMGHPYARRAPNPPMPAGIINVQTGRFRDSWFTVPPEAQGGMIVSRLPNSAPEARFLDGTAKMIDRPVLEILVNRLRDIRRRNVTHAMRAVLRGE